MLRRLVLLCALVASWPTVQRAQAQPFDSGLADARPTLRVNGAIPDTAATGAGTGTGTGAETATGTGVETATGTGTGTETGTGTGTGSGAEPISSSRRAGAVAAALVPGLLARGAGSYLVHRPRAARRLLVVGGIGLASAVLGGVPLYATYGSGKVVVPGVHFAVGGTGLLLASWWSDIYVAAGGVRLGGRPRAPGPYALEVAATWQHDDFLGERLMLAPAAELRRGGWVARAAGLVALDGTAAGGRADLEVRPWSRPPPTLPSAAASRHTASTIALRAAIQLHAEDDQGFALITGELAVRGRLELARLDAHLAGSFLELDEGLGLEVVDYAHARAEVNTILLSRFAWGLYLPRGHGEVSVFYDHRRDQLAGGFPAGRAAGFLGSIGAEGEVFTTRGWLVRARVELGNSVLTTIGLRRELP